MLELNITKMLHSSGTKGYDILTVVGPFASVKINRWYPVNKTGQCSDPIIEKGFNSKQAIEDLVSEEVQKRRSRGYRKTEGLYQAFTDISAVCAFLEASGCTNVSRKLVSDCLHLFPPDDSGAKAGVDFSVCDNLNTNDSDDRTHEQWGSW